MKPSFTLLTALLLAPQATPAIAPQPNGKPNTIILLVDDMGYGDRHFNATPPRLMGLDYKRLPLCHNGLERRLTNGHGQAVKDMWARELCDRDLRGIACSFKIP